MVFKRILIIVFFTVVMSSSWGQPPPAPASQPQNPQTDPDNPVPITGLEYLALAGAAYGVHRITKKKNKINEEA
jgi:hypothetical protein